MRQTSGNPLDFSRQPRGLADWVAMAFLLGAIVVLAACSGGSNGKETATEAVKETPTASVPVEKVEERAASVDLVELKVSGTVQAHARVHVKAQVTARLMSVHCKEGRRVEKGDLLFSLDPQPSEARLRRERANLARNEAKWRRAQNQVGNYSSMLKKGYIAKARYEEVVAAEALLDAEVKAGEAAVESASVELKHCSIHAPIGGVTGEILVDEGNVVEADGDTLVVISQVDPVYVVFEIQEKNLPLLKAAVSRETVQLEAIVPGEKERTVAGELSFIDNKVDPETGTIRIKGTFPNERGMLWPGQSVEVRVSLDHGDGRQ